MKDENDSTGLKAKTHVITVKIHFALREAEPRVLV